MSFAGQYLRPYTIAMKQFRLALLPPLIALMGVSLAGCTPPQSVIDAFHSGTAPAIDSVVLRPSGQTIYADLHFHSADGNVVAIHRDIISSDSPHALPVLSDTRVDADAAQQKTGAIFTDHYSCDGARYHAVIRAYLIDSNHNHSNPQDYTITCAE